MPGKGSLICVERTLDLYEGGCATQTFVSDVVSHISDQCNKEAKCEELQCSSNYFNAFIFFISLEKIFHWWLSTRHFTPLRQRLGT